MHKCVFCQIANKLAPASIIYEDAQVIAFMALHPSRPGEFILAPKSHYSEIEDIDDITYDHFMKVLKKLSIVQKTALKPAHVGWIVHGFCINHAHVIVVPQFHKDDITSARWAKVIDGNVVFDEANIELPTRTELDEMAERIKSQLDGISTNS